MAVLTGGFVALYTTTDACAVGNHAGGNPSVQAQADA